MGYIFYSTTELKGIGVTSWGKLLNPWYMPGHIPPGGGIRSDFWWFPMICLLLFGSISRYEIPKNTEAGTFFKRRLNKQRWFINIHSKSNIGHIFGPNLEWLATYATPCPLKDYWCYPLGLDWPTWVVAATVSCLTYKKRRVFHHDIDHIHRIILYTPWDGYIDIKWIKMI